MDKSRSKSWDVLMSSSKYKCKKAILADLNNENIKDNEEQVKHYNWLKILNNAFVISNQKFEHVCEFDFLCKDFEIRHSFINDQVSKSMCFCFDSQWITRNRIIVNGILSKVAKVIFMKKLRYEREIIILTTDELFEEVVNENIRSKNVDEILQELTEEIHKENQIEIEFLNKQEETDRMEQLLYGKIDFLMNKGSKEEQELAEKFKENYPFQQCIEDDTLSMSYSYIDEESSDSYSSTTSQFSDSKLKVNIDLQNGENSIWEFDFETSEVSSTILELSKQAFEQVLVPKGKVEILKDRKETLTNRELEQNNLIFKILSYNKLFLYYCILRSRQSKLCTISKQEKIMNKLSEKLKSFEQIFGYSIFEAKKTESVSNKFRTIEKK